MRKKTRKEQHWVRIRKREKWEAAAKAPPKRAPQQPQTATEVTIMQSARDAYSERFIYSIFMPDGNVYHTPAIAEMPTETAPPPAASLRVGQFVWLVLTGPMGMGAELELLKIQRFIDGKIPRVVLEAENGGVSTALREEILGQPSRLGPYYCTVDPSAFHALYGPVTTRVAPAKPSPSPSSPRDGGPRQPSPRDTWVLRL